MGSKRRQKQLADDAAEPPQDAAEYDAFRAHLGLSLVSDMFGHHQACAFKDCRAAGRCLAFDKAGDVCPMPLDTTRALIFAGMMLFDNAMCAEEKPFHHVLRAEDMVLLDGTLSAEPSGAGG